jgi:hypothetical protein
MFYILQTACISPQQTFSGTKIDLSQEYEPEGNKMKAQEPPYPGIPQNILRRMAKAVRMGVGTALPLIGGAPAGIIIGSANGGMEESGKFLNQIVEYKEEMLTPGNFVQSIPNAIASQISLLSQNKGYNTTHVHRGLAFEYAAIDAAMMLKEYPSDSYLVGGVDEIASYHYNLEYLKGSYKKEPLSGKRLYEVDSPGSIVGEGAAMFLVSNEKAGALAKLQGVVTLHSEEEAVVTGQLQDFLEALGATAGEEASPAGVKIDLFLTGENGDNRTRHFYTACESLLDKDVTIARFKHMSGEYPTASAFALWAACQLIGGQPLPEHMIKRAPVAAGSAEADADSGNAATGAEAGKAEGTYKNILIYNNYKGLQHSYMLVSKAN